MQPVCSSYIVLYAKFAAGSSQRFMFCALYFHVQEEKYRREE